jgi:hypothetical protein
LILILILIFGQGRPPTFEIYVLEGDEEDEDDEQQEQGVQVEPEEGVIASSSLTGSRTPAATNLNLERVAIRSSHQVS